MRAAVEYMELGDELPPVSQRFNVSMFGAGGLRTIHNDQQAAEREGLKAPIAVGPQVAALIYRMMRGAFRQGWVIGGRTSLTFRRATDSNAFATARGRLRAKMLDGERVRYEFDVWVEDERGERTIVGTASALGPQSGQGGGA